jgi:DNA-binding transcriptional ArsR family regulator
MSKSRNKDLAKYADMFKALSNESRLQIFLRLISCCAPGGPCSDENEPCYCIGELGRDLKIAPSTVSHHIKELRNAGLIQIERKGQNIECRVNPEAIEKLSGFLDNRIAI